jgi:hypothetical protein
MSMVYSPPTAADLKARFPEFVPVGDSLINLLLAEAGAQVGETWVKRDRKPATLYLAAHLLTMEGEPGRTATGQSSAASGPVRRRKVGDVEMEFATPGATGRFAQASIGLDGSVYGQQFMRLQRLNFPGVAVV